MAPHFGTSWQDQRNRIAVGISVSAIGRGIPVG